MLHFSHIDALKKKIYPEVLAVLSFLNFTAVIVSHFFCYCLIVDELVNCTNSLTLDNIHQHFFFPLKAFNQAQFTFNINRLRYITFLILQLLPGNNANIYRNSNTLTVHLCSCDGEYLQGIALSHFTSSPPLIH